MDKWDKLNEAICKMQDALFDHKNPSMGLIKEVTVSREAYHYLKYMISCCPEKDHARISSSYALNGGEINIRGIRFSVKD